MPHCGGEGRPEVQRVVEVGEPVVAAHGGPLVARIDEGQGRNQADWWRLGPGRPQAQRPVSVVEGGDHLVGRDGGGERRQRVLRSGGHGSVLQEKKTIFVYYSYSIN